MLAVFLLPGVAHADEFDAQINALKQQIKDSQSAANAKASEANTLKNKISQIQSQINAAIAALNLTKTEIAQTQAQIQQAQNDIEIQKELLRKNIRLAQTQSDVTPLEVIASANNLADYMNKQEYLKGIADKISDSLAKIAQLKRELDDKNAQLAAKKADQVAQVNTISAQQAEQQSLLAQTQGQEAAYQSIVADSNKQLQAIYAERSRRDAANGVGVSTGGTGGYPYANDSFNSLDPWGFYKRECVSYVAWKRRAVGRAPYPNFWGNAGQWDSFASWTNTPSAGAIAVFDPGVQGAGGVGHVSYVESVNGNGTINVSEYNWSNPHNFTSRTNVPASGIKFIP